MQAAKPYALRETAQRGALQEKRRAVGFGQIADDGQAEPGAWLSLVESSASRASTVPTCSSGTPGPSSSTESATTWPSRRPLT